MLEAHRIYSNGTAFRQIETQGHFIDLPLKKQSHVLFITFENANPPFSRPDGLRDPWGMRFLRREGHDVVGIKVKQVDWYRCPEFHAAFTSSKVTDVISAYDHVILYGSSMGGYAALALAEAIPGCDVIAHNPQSTLAPHLVPFDSRFPIGSRQDWTGRFVDGAEGCQGARRVFVSYDPHETCDRQHVERLQAHNLVRIPVPFVGHAIPEWLHQMGALATIIRGVVQGSLDQQSAFRLARGRRKISRYYLQLARRCRRPELALALLERADQSVHSESDLRDRLAVYKAQGLWSEAIRFLESDRVRKSSISVHRETSEVLFRKGDPAAAVPHAQAAASANPGRPDYTSHLAEVLLAAGRIPEALTAAEAAVKAGADWPTALRTLARCFWSSGRQSEALAAVARAVDSDPQNAYGHFLKGEYLLATGETEGAEVHFRRSLMLAPDFGRAREGLRLAVQASRKKQPGMNLNSDQELRGLDHVQQIPSKMELAARDGAAPTARRLQDGLSGWRNEAFSSEHAVKQLTALLQATVARTAREGLSLSDYDVEEIGSAAAESARLVATYYGLIRRFAKVRRENLLLFQDLTFVSVGEDCFSRTVATQWGLKQSAKMGEKSVPFDLSVHSAARVGSLIRSGFADYLDPKFLRYDSSAKICTNVKWNVRFNHESGPEYAESSFERLIEIYNRRIGQFHSIMSSSGPKILLLHVRQPSDLSRILARSILDDIRQTYGRSDLHLINIQTWPSNAALVAEDVITNDYAELNVRYPFPDYVWHLPQHCFSLDGHRFEELVVDGIKQVVKAWFAGDFSEVAAG